jgi:hypothetical protein
MTKIGKLDGEGTFPGTRGNDKVAPKAVTLAVQTSKFTPGASLSLSPGSAGDAGDSAKSLSSTAPIGSTAAR